MVTKEIPLWSWIGHWDWWSVSKNDVAVKWVGQFSHSIQWVHVNQGENVTFILFWLKWCDLVRRLAVFAYNFNIAAGDLNCATGLSCSHTLLAASLSICLSLDTFNSMLDAVCLSSRVWSRKPRRQNWISGKLADSSCSRVVQSHKIDCKNPFNLCGASMLDWADRKVAIKHYTDTNRQQSTPCPMDTFDSVQLA